MEISSISFLGRPIYHQIPPIYEDLGLPDLSSFIEQRIEFVYTMGKSEKVGHGSIRYYKNQAEYKIFIPEKLHGVGPFKLQKLKELLLEEAREDFIHNMQTETDDRKVYYPEFRRRNE